MFFFVGIGTTMARTLDASLRHDDELFARYAPVRKHTRVVNRAFNLASRAKYPQTSVMYAPVRRRLGGLDRGLQSVFNFLASGLQLPSDAYSEARAKAEGSMSARETADKNVRVG
jgi:hypothetical protein